jgi:predicted S18 family serine protease
MTEKNRVLRYWIVTPLIGGVLAIGGCVAARVPTAPTVALAQADTAVRQATESKASTYAPAELSKAREKLLSAQAAMNMSDYERARLLAEEATVDAQLAQAKGEARDAEHDAAELRAAIDALRVEAARPIIP